MQGSSLSSKSPLLAAFCAGFLLAACGDDTETSGSGGAAASSSTTTVTTATTATGSPATTGAASTATGTGQGGDEGTGGGGGEASGGGTGSGGDASGTNIGTEDRPVDLQFPAGYDDATPTPLIILLHGYGATGALQNVYFGMSPVADEYGVLFASPDGTTDPSDRQFWNATDACCNFFGSEVDDSAYLAGLVAAAQEIANVDPKRIYFVGHSNGGFMSYRMACDHADTIAAIASLAGATFAGDECEPSEPVAALQIHGTADETIAYDGGNVGAPGAGDFPGAKETVELWAGYDGCDLEATDGEPRDIEGSIDGEETTVSIYDQGCDPHGATELWTVPGGTHIPDLSATFSEQIVEWLLAHPKP